MNRAFLFALFGAFLVLASMQPARAFRTLVVQNRTGTFAHVDIIYYTVLCKDDRFKLGAGAGRSINIGACHIKSFTAWIEDSAGKGQPCRANNVLFSEYQIIVNREPAVDYCTVVGKR